MEWPIQYTLGPPNNIQIDFTNRFLIVINLKKRKRKKKKTQKIYANY